MAWDQGTFLGVTDVGLDSPAGLEASWSVRPSFSSLCSVAGGCSGCTGDRAFVAGVLCVLVLCEDRKSIVVLDGGSA